MELKPTYQVIFIVLILILFTVIVSFTIYLSKKNKNSKEKILLEKLKNDINQINQLDNKETLLKDLKYNIKKIET